MWRLVRVKCVYADCFWILGFAVLVSMKQRLTWRKAAKKPNQNTLSISKWKIIPYIWRQRFFFLFASSVEVGPICWRNAWDILNEVIDLLSRGESKQRYLKVSLPEFYKFPHRKTNFPQLCRRNYPYTGLYRPLGLQNVQTPRISRLSFMKVSRSSASAYRRSSPPPLPSETSLLFISVRCWELSPWKFPMTFIGKRTRDLPAWSAAP
jgi:hypothetical protein